MQSVRHFALFIGSTYISISIIATRLSFCGLNMFCLWALHNFQQRNISASHCISLYSNPINKQLKENLALSWTAWLWPNHMYENMNRYCSLITTNKYTCICTCTCVSINLYIYIIYIHYVCVYVHYLSFLDMLHLLLVIYLTSALISIVNTIDNGLTLHVYNPLTSFLFVWSIITVLSCLYSAFLS